MVAINNELENMKLANRIDVIHSSEMCRFTLRPEHYKVHKALFLHHLAEEKRDVVAKLAEFGVNYDGA